MAAALIGRRALLAQGSRLCAAETVQIGVPGAARASQAIAAHPSEKVAPAAPSTPFPTIAFTDASGTVRSVSDYRGHGVVLNFWATWCAPCIRELPSLEDLSETLSPDRIAVLPIATDGRTPLAVRSFMHDHAVHRLPVFLDPNKAAARLLRVTALPTTFLLDRNGGQVLRVNHALDWSDTNVVASVRQLLV